MILPDKQVAASRSLLGAGASLLEALRTPQSLTSLWEAARVRPETYVYWRFVLALDLLYAIGAIEYRDGVVRRQVP